MTERELNKVTDSLEGLSQEDRVEAIARAVLKHDVNLELVDEAIVRIEGDNIQAELNRDNGGEG